MLIPHDLLRGEKKNCIVFNRVKLPAVVNCDFIKLKRKLRKGSKASFTDNLSIQTRVVIIEIPRELPFIWSILELKNL